MASSGNRVRTIAQERVDKPDFDSKDDLVYNYLDSTLGALLGYGGGMLSPAKTTFTDDGVTYNVALGAFHAYYSARETFDAATNTYRSWQGKVLTHIPGGSQVSVLDYTAARAAAVAANVVPTGIPAATPGAFPFVWMRPSQVDTNTEARRYWDGATEASVAMATRTTTLLEFTIADGAPSDVGGAWVPIAKITYWDGAGTAVLGLPTLTQLSVWDGGGIQGSSAYSDPWKWADAEEGVWYDPAGNTSTASRLLPSIAGGGISYPGFGAMGQNPSFGLIQMLYVVRARVKRLLADDGSVSWLSAPAATIKALKATVDDLLARVAPLEVPPYMHMACILDYNAGPQTYTARALSGANASAYNVGGATRTGVGQVGVYPPTLLPAGYRVVSVSAQGHLDNVIVAARPNGSGVILEIYHHDGTAKDAAVVLTVWAKEN